MGEDLEGGGGLELQAEIQMLSTKHASALQRSEAEGGNERSPLQQPLGGKGRSAPPAEHRTSLEEHLPAHGGGIHRSLCPRWDSQRPGRLC